MYILHNFICIFVYEYNYERASDSIELNEFV